jgi:hypothetical protein
VHLRQDFQIVYPSRHIISLLGFPTETVTGSDFCSYIASEAERQRFIDALERKVCIASAEEPDSPVSSSVRFQAENASMLHVTMRDAYCREFQVYAYHTSVRDLNGQTRYIVGIVEAGERQPLLAPLSRSESNSAPLSNKPICRQKSQWQSSASSRTKRVQSDLSRLDLVCRANDLQIVENRTVGESCSDIEAGRSFSSYIEDGTFFAKYLRRLNSVLNGDDSLPDTSDLVDYFSTTVEFTVKGNKRDKKYRADVLLEVAFPADELDGETVIRVKDIISLKWLRSSCSSPSHVTPRNSIHGTPRISTPKPLTIAL